MQSLPDETVAVVLTQGDPCAEGVQTTLKQLTRANRLLYRKYKELSNGKTWPKPPVYIPQQRLNAPGIGAKPQNELMGPSITWTKGHDPPPQSTFPVPVFVLSHEDG